MKKFLLIVSICFITLPTFSYAQDNGKSSGDEYCILRFYGSGYLGKAKGLYKIFDDLKIEKTDLKGSSPEETLTSIMERINYIKDKDYKLVTSSHSTTGAEFYEYVFIKE